MKWLDLHALKTNAEAFLFINIGTTKRGQQLRPENINKMIRRACRDLEIQKPITCYSLQRNGVTLRRLRGETDMDIQHAARWRSSRQLRIYDLSSQDEGFKRALQKRGLIPNEQGEVLAAQRCLYCDRLAGFGDKVCRQCKRPLDRSAVRKEEKLEDVEIHQLKDEIQALTSGLASIKEKLMQELAREILSGRPLRPTRNQNQMEWSLFPDKSRKSPSPRQVELQR